MPRSPLVRNVLVGCGLAVLVGGGILLVRSVDADALRAWKENAPPLPFFIALAVLPLVGFPTTPFFLVAGATYGMGVGLVGTVAALAVNFLLSYVIAGSALRSLVVRLLAKTKHRLPEIDAEHGVRFTLVVRMIPAMPNFVKNYLLCLAGVPFWTYFLLSMGISFAYAAPFVVLGESIFEQDLQEVLIAVAVLALLGAGAKVLYQKLKG